SRGGAQRIWIDRDRPFLFTSVKLFNSREGEETVHDLTPITVRIAPGAKVLSWFGSDGLSPAKAGKTSYLFLAAVEPASRNGMVGGWITHERASGIVAGTSRGGGLEVAARSA